MNEGIGCPGQERCSVVGFLMNGVGMDSSGVRS